MASNSTRVIREALVQAAASATAERYAEIIPLPAYGMVFDAYFDALRDQLLERLGIPVEAGSSEGELRYLLLDP
jgi:hypothetical protein